MTDSIKNRLHNNDGFHFNPTGFIQKVHQILQPLVKKSINNYPRTVTKYTMSKRSGKNKNIHHVNRDVIESNRMVIGAVRILRIQHLDVCI